MLLHLVAGAQWAGAQKKQGIPELPKLTMMEVGEWRSEEITQANMVLEWRPDRGDQIAHELRSLSRDVISACRDRDYRIITVFPNEPLLAHLVNVRVPDLRTREAGGRELRVGLFQVPGGKTGRL